MMHNSNVSTNAERLHSHRGLNMLQCTKRPLEVSLGSNTSKVNEWCFTMKRVLFRTLDKECQFSEKPY